MHTTLTYSIDYQPQLVEETRADFLHRQLFFLFLILCSCDKAHLLPKERDSLCLWIAICVFNILCRRITWIKINFFQIIPHVLVDLYIAGEHLDIIRIKNKNHENQRFYSLRVYYLSHFILCCGEDLDK